jgi:hypothetical protein
MNGGLPLGNLVTDTPPPSPLPTFPFSNTDTLFRITTNSGLVTYYAFYANINLTSPTGRDFFDFRGVDRDKRLILQSCGLLKRL